MSDTRVLVVLQNAWSPRWAGKVWPRQLWLRALMNCPTGRRIARLFPMESGEEDDFAVEDGQFRFLRKGVYATNTTPFVGAVASSVVPPDEDHILEAIGVAQPDWVLACGNQAGGVMKRLWKGRLVLMPHPSPANRRWRTTDFLWLREYFDGGDFHRVAIRLDGEAPTPYALDDREE